MTPLAPAYPNDLLANRIAAALVTDMSVIASPPDVCLKVNALMSDPRASADDLARVVLRDPALAARVLRLANSSFYRLANRVDTVSRAINVLGFAELQKLVLALSAVETFSRLSSEVTNMNAFWRHGVYTGLLAQAIARRCGVLRPERLFVAGVMHDIGTLILNHRYPELAEEMIREANGDEAALHRIERRELGFEHAQLGSLMLEHWQLPASISEAVNWHHEPQLSRVAPVEAAVVYVAELIANASGTGSFSELPGPALHWDPSPLTRLGLPVNFTPDQLMDDVDQEYVETLCLFLT